MRPTEKDIESNGIMYRLPCDGRHDHAYHRYITFSKKEVMKMWRKDHPISKENAS